MLIRKPAKSAISKPVDMMGLTDDADDFGLDDGLAELGVDGVARDRLLAVVLRHGHREVRRGHPTAAGTRGLGREIKDECCMLAQHVMVGFPLSHSACQQYNSIDFIL